MASFKEVLQLSILEHQQDEEVGVWLLKVQVGEDHQVPHGHMFKYMKLLMITPRMMPWGICMGNSNIPRMGAII
jgi:hypothetical protein